MIRSLALALAVVGLLAAQAAAEARHVVIVSIDGLRPEFYLDGAFPAPALRGLVARGAHARAVDAVFPSVTYPSHASVVTGVRPMRHGVAFNNVFQPDGARGRWYEEAADLKVQPIWEWARAAGLTTAAVSWPATLGSSIDLLLPERDYYARREPLALLRAAVTPGLFRLTRVEPDVGIFRDVVRWDEFLARTAIAIVRESRPRLLLVHLVQLDHVQHRGGRDGADVAAAVGRVDAHLGDVVEALRAAGIAERSAVIVVGDHGFADFERLVAPNAALARAGLRGCPRPGPGWRATAHVAGGAAAVFVRPGDADARARAESVLRVSAPGRYTVLTRAELDALGAMPGAALGLEAAAGWSVDGSCERLTRGARGGMHGYLPGRPAMATGLVAAGAGVRPGAVLPHARLIDVAPTAARLLGIAAPDVEGRVLVELLAEP
jgi:arylsulfatase A-like enzyme